MSKPLYIKPAPGLKVRDPRNGEHLPETGAEKPRTRYWLRRLKDNDVVETGKRAAAKAKSKE